uniref:Transcription factor bHLH48-like isoform X1 n=1 Tax=Cymbidium ensifolium TaxID=78740 RepID=A0A515HG68_CYMEN|nr:transcription factor bHLH48-like isoform X1 [Cymbidium ensifolium]
MEPARCSGAGSGNSGAYATEMTETLRFEEEIQSLMRDNVIHQGFECSSPENAGGSSFTALLGLHPSQALELLHEVDPSSSGGFRLGDPKTARLPLNCSPTFPSNAALIERATRFSVFAASEDSPEGSSAFPSNSDGDHSPNPKSDQPDSDLKPQRQVKRKETEKSSKVIFIYGFLSS